MLALSEGVGEERNDRRLRRFVILAHIIANMFHLDEHAGSVHPLIGLREVLRRGSLGGAESAQTRLFHHIGGFGDERHTASMLSV